MNHATRTIAATLGVIFAISGMSHGLFEIFQGNTPTNGVIIEAISESMRQWPHGNEMAFTLMPTFLIAGIASIAVGLAIIVWSLRYLHTRHGATVYLLLFVLLFLVGGGIAQIVFFTVGWAFATRIHKPLTWWRKVLPESVRGTLARVWPWTLAVGSLLFLFALEIAIFGYVPGVDDADQRLSVVFASLGIALILIILSFVSGFADDIQRQTGAEQVPAMRPRRT
jgi:hypothetical protein